MENDISNNILSRLINMADKYPQKIAALLDDQCWTYCELMDKIGCVAMYLNRLKIQKGQIIYQFMDRGLEMIVGIFGIMVAGGVYCPLNCMDPTERIVGLIEQFQGRYALLHKKTWNQFPKEVVENVLLIEEILSSVSGSEIQNNSLVYWKDGAAYIICTSGTTGKSKAIVHTHQSLGAGTAAYASWSSEIYTEKEQVLQLAASSWVLHLIEISLPLIVGGTVILLRSGGNLDLTYLCHVLNYAHVSTMTIGPAFVRALISHFELTNQIGTLIKVKHCVITGEAIQPQEWTTFLSFLNLEKTKIFTLYGMSECNGALGCQWTGKSGMKITMGHPLPGVQCLLIDEQGETISPGGGYKKLGQIHIGGSTLFAGYLNDDERTRNSLIRINDLVYLKTGDLAMYHESGELLYMGRTDFQIKIRGQRVETSEIEHVIVNWPLGKISNCLVMKHVHNDDLLVAYLISREPTIDKTALRQHCGRFLQKHTIPMYFILLDRFPVNANGKIDRKQLPTPKFVEEEIECDEKINLKPISELEIQVQKLWSEILHQDNISLKTDFFSIGGESLLMMKLYLKYRLVFDIDGNIMKINELLQYPTLEGHVLIINKSIEEQRANADIF